MNRHGAKTANLACICHAAVAAERSACKTLHGRTWCSQRGPAAVRFETAAALHGLLLERGNHLAQLLRRLNTSKACSCPASMGPAYLLGVVFALLQLLTGLLHLWQLLPPRVFQTLHFTCFGLREFYPGPHLCCPLSASSRPWHCSRRIPGFGDALFPHKTQLLLHHTSV